MDHFKFLEPTALLEKIYATLCSEYEDAQFYENEQDQQEIELSKRRLTKKLLCEIAVEGKCFLVMNKQKFKDRFAMYEDDFIKIIKNCADKGVPFSTFTELVDSLLISAYNRWGILEQLEEEVQKSQKLGDQREIEDVLDDEEVFSLG